MCLSLKHIGTHLFSLHVATKAVDSCSWLPGDGHWWPVKEKKEVGIGGKGRIYKRKNEWGNFNERVF